MNLANQREEHIGELTLRRRRAGEALGPDGPAIEAHATSCADCRARIRALDDEQRRFEQEISFDRFAAGVERAARGDRAVRRAARARFWVPSLAGLAAAAAMLVVVVRTSGDDPGRRHPYSGIKGSAGITVRVAGVDGQRNARVDSAEPLSRGERLRIGYYVGEHRYRYLLSLSIDDRGEVTPLYPERGTSAALTDASSATHYLPPSWVLDGAGTEHIIVVMSDSPIDVETAKRAARAAYDKAGGNLARMPSLDLPGEQFVRTFSKP
jgi:hypothetical protein